MPNILDDSWLKLVEEFGNVDLKIRAYLALI